jgi:PleD family two-component response regulator
MGPVRATAWAGVALAGRGEGFEEVLNRADASLYRAKNGGRNRVSAELKLHTVQAAG